MTTTTFFIIFIPVLSIILLFVNLLLAPHNSYQEKDSSFECGFHSFLYQNREQFGIAFFRFGLVFIVFDVEIMMVVSKSASLGFTQGYGMTIFLIFFAALTLGFIFELGKNALTIESKQTSISKDQDVPKPCIYFIKSDFTRSLLCGLDNSKRFTAFF